MERVPRSRGRAALSVRPIAVTFKMPHLRRSNSFLDSFTTKMSPLRGYYIIMPPLQCTDSFFVRHFYHYVTAPRFGYRFLRKTFCEGHFRLFCFFWVSESQPVPLWRKITRIVTDF